MIKKRPSTIGGQATNRITADVAAQRVPDVGGSSGGGILSVSGNVVRVTSASTDGGGGGGCATDVGGAAIGSGAIGMEV